MKNLFDVATTNFKGSEFATIETTTICKVAKKWGISGVVTKKSIKSVYFGASYESAVNAHLERKARENGKTYSEAQAARTFKAESLPYGEWVVANRVFQYKGEFYLRIYVYNGSVKSEEFFIDGRKATAEEVVIIKAATAKGGSKKQSEAGLDEAEQVRPLGVKFESVERFACHHEEYVKPNEIRLVAE